MTTPADQPDLIAWLRARLDDDERVATDRGRLAGDVWTAVEVAPGRWEVIGAGGRGVVATGLPQWEAAHIARHDPARVLAEVDAKRHIVDLHPYAGLRSAPESCGSCASHPGPCDTLRLLALPYADRPGYRDEWRPA